MYKITLNSIERLHTTSLCRNHTTRQISWHDFISWSCHIRNTASRASKTLNFLRWNLYKCSEEVKASAYISLVRPLMEYACKYCVGSIPNHLH